MKKIRSAFPDINLEDINAVKGAIKNGWGKNMNKYIDKFEQKFSKYVNKKYCISVSHCTDAIHLALLSLNINKNDEVLVPDFTWVASAAPIKYVGAKPIFVDVRKDSWCINEDLIENKITKKTKAIIVVDLLGNMPNWEKIIKIAKKYKLKIIEDAAESIGAKYKNKLAGTFGDISVFSFNATKLLMTGQGGIFCTSNKNFFKKAKLIKNHGIDQQKTGKYYWSTTLGYNYNWTNFQAALALSQFKRIKQLIKYKKNLFKKYEEYLNQNSLYKLNSNLDNVNPTYWISCLILNKKLGLKKELFIKKISKYNIDIRPIFYPLSSMPTFSEKGVNYRKIHRVSYELSNYGICLPSGNNLTNKDISYICDSIHKVIKPYSKNIK